LFGEEGCFEILTGGKKRKRRGEEGGEGKKGEMFYSHESSFSPPFSSLLFSALGFGSNALL
jgi:hypothetical protein